jgi:hypothetical protein
MSAPRTLDPAAPRAMPGRSMRAPSRYTLFVPSGRWPSIVLSATIVAVLFFPIYVNESLWLGAALFLLVLVGRHTVEASARAPWLPGLVTLIALIQGVFGSWAAYHMPQGVFPMAVPEPEYFAFAVPSVLALTAGMYLPLLSPGRSPARHVGELAAPLSTGRLATTCDQMVWVGLGLRLFVQPLVGAGLSFAVSLVASISYVGAYGLLLLGSPRWRTRLAVVLLVEASLAAVDGIFIGLISWCAHSAVLIVYGRRTKPWSMFAIAGVALVVLMAINGFKRDYRREIASTNVSLSDRATLATQRFIETVTDPAILFSPENVAVNASRLNQGNITSRILFWVPVREPYADGETIAEDFRAALLPRFLAPDKYISGANNAFTRFTGLVLPPGTAIGLSVPGELYGNYGARGELIGVFVYGLMIGTLVRFFIVRAAANPLWFAWSPVVLFSTISAESELGGILNQVTKSIVVMLAVVYVVPAWRTLRLARGRPSVAVEPRA